MLDAGTQAEKTRTRRKCAPREDRLIYMKGIIFPGDKTKVRVWEGVLSVPSHKERKWQRRAYRSLPVTLVPIKEPGGIKPMRVSNILT